MLLLLVAVVGVVLGWTLSETFVPALTESGRVMAEVLS